MKPSITVIAAALLSLFSTGALAQKAMNTDIVVIGAGGGGRGARRVPVRAVDRLDLGVLFGVHPGIAVEDLAHGAARTRGTDSL
ncbi:MAG: hypothetical protein RR412_04020 [Burkholderiaceae bacterium]